MVHEEIGRGGFGIVYRAVEQSTQNEVAIKIFNPAKNNRSAESLERFRREGTNGKKLRHPNAVRVIETGATSNEAFIVMELLRGQTLEQTLERNKVLDPEHARDICASVCDALAAAHELGIVHRDIKPENVFLHIDPAEHEVVKVLDLGVAKLTGDVLPKLTATGAVVGTPTYVAPERFRGEPFDGRSDVFSVGVLFFRCITGRLPFRSSTSDFLSVVSAVLNDEPTLDSTEAVLLPELRALIDRVLVKDPKQRPDAATLAQDLRALIL